MISENIKAQRMQKGLTQKELADLLYLTPQAISRWEKGDVEPSVDAISSMAKIFDCTTDELIYGIKTKPNVEIVKEVVNQVVEEKTNNQSQKQFLAVCEICNNPIYESEEIVRNPVTPNNLKVAVACKNCLEKIEQDIYSAQRDYGIKQRYKSFIVSGIIAGIILILAILSNSLQTALVGVVVSAMAFTFSSCLFLKNNFICDLFFDVSSWGLVSFPGIIFEFSLDGFIFLIVIKLLFVVLGYALGLLATILALVICLPLSLIAYPFALIKNLHNPEKTEDDD